MHQSRTLHTNPFKKVCHGATWARITAGEMHDQPGRATLAMIQLTSIPG